ncbi:MAG: PadR family transcriptional regulator [Candidatus Izemoplasmatales bacterium]|jgi:PadR family transcriptional regulator PadR|nr:PadR family transcriptional regulator [Candidatus Izemoplasmatales bacterium]NLF49491.1 PadR family transcriptional regulator [Acholeplasmataceae bacterium]
MNAQFKKGIIEMCVMHLVEQQPMYGFEVIESLAKDIDVNENTIYPILRRLTDQGYFSTYTEATNIGAPRKYYRITESGKDRMEEYRKEWNRFLKGVFRILEGRTV